MVGAGREEPKVWRWCEVANPTGNHEIYHGSCSPGYILIGRQMPSEYTRRHVGITDFKRSFAFYKALMDDDWASR